MFNRFRTLITNASASIPNAPKGSGGGGGIATLVTVSAGVGLGAYGLYHSVITGIHDYLDIKIFVTINIS